MDDMARANHGALIGWTVEDLGSKLALRMESVSKPPPFGEEDVLTFLYVLDKNQAVQLGNYLFEICGQTAPRKKRDWLDRLLGE